MTRASRTVLCRGSRRGTRPGNRRPHSLAETTDSDEIVDQALAGMALLSADGMTVILQQSLANGSFAALGAGNGKILWRERPASVQQFEPFRHHPLHYRFSPGRHRLHSWARPSHGLLPAQRTPPVAYRGPWQGPALGPRLQSRPRPGGIAGGSHPAWPVRIRPLRRRACLGSLLRGRRPVRALDGREFRQPHLDLRRHHIAVSQAGECMTPKVQTPRPPCLLTEASASGRDRKDAGTDESRLTCQLN